MRWIVSCLAILFPLLPAWASEPGQPLDCSDWVFLEPGHSCVAVPSDSIFGRRAGALTTALNDGSLAAIKGQTVGLSCGSHTRWELLRLEGNSETLVGYVEDRCVNDATQRADIIQVMHVEASPSGGQTLAHFTFDPTNGRLSVPMKSRCVEMGTFCPDYVGDETIYFIGGFATTFEILQSYEPPTGPVSFRVPYMPEGFQYADWFDTFYGDLATVGDWSQAQPLQCGYPATPPSVGDYLTVEDTLPDPSLDQGYYYVTAVHHQGQVRYGRQSNGGALTGRDPAVLPGCQ